MTDLTDRFTVRAVIIFLGSICLVFITGLFVLAWAGVDVPAAAVAFGSAALGALAGVLAKTSSAESLVTSTIAPPKGPVQ